jgi:hypothetical protein
MQSTTNIEQSILQNLRSLPMAKQQEVLKFTERLRETLPKAVKLSLRELAAMPLAQRNQYIAPFILKTADDFLNDPELTEFSILDTEDWELEDDQP